MNLFDRYYKDALRIYAICGDDSLSDDEARLLTYMHVKAIESGKGIDYFNGPSESDDEALKVLTGEARFEGQIIAPNGDTVTLADTFVSGIGNHVRSLDNSLEHEAGFENRCTGELRRRRMLYNDPAFRAKMTALYSEKIAPRVFGYTDDAVCRSFERFREKADFGTED